MAEQTWTVGYNETRKQWMVWSDESPAIAFCLSADDAATIADALNALCVKCPPWAPHASQVRP